MASIFRKEERALAQLSGAGNRILGDTKLVMLLAVLGLRLG